ncbi:MAG: hypothetical protein WAN76_02560, partial [Candidatus Sulfotelmatobacter sp.]
HAAFDVAGAGNVTMAAGLRSIAKVLESPPAPTVRAPVPDPTDEREQETELRQTGLRRVMRKHPNSHREATATAPVLDSTSSSGYYLGSHPTLRPVNRNRDDRLGRRFRTASSPSNPTDWTRAAYGKNSTGSTLRRRPR